MLNAPSVAVVAARPPPRSSTAPAIGKPFLALITVPLIGATIFVERDSQKGILIGEGGAMMKTIGSAARKEIEEMGGRKVFLELRVKVLKDWRNDEGAMQRLGYRMGKKKKR